MRTLIFICFCALLAAIAVSDCRSRKIPDKLVGALFIVGIVSAFVMPEIGFFSAIAGILAGGLPLFLVAMALPGAFGGGDVKLMAAAGMFLGAKLILSVLIFGLLGGGIYAGVCLLAGRLGRKERFAMGPFLCMGIVAAYFFGEILWR